MPAQFMFLQSEALIDVEQSLRHHQSAPPSPNFCCWVLKGVKMDLSTKSLEEHRSIQPHTHIQFKENYISFSLPFTQINVKREIFKNVLLCI